MSGSTLDINNNHFFVNYGSNADPVATIRAYLVSGRAGGAWNGTGLTVPPPPCPRTIT